MNEEPQGKSQLLFWAAAMVAAVVLYILSIGPAALITRRSACGGHAVQIIYAPVFWLHENTLLAKPLEAYVEWWGVRGGG